MAASVTHPLPRALAVAAGLALILLTAAAAAARPVHAASTLVVNTLSDGHLDTGASTCTSATAGGKCTLRAALELNDAERGGNAVTLGPVGTNQFTLSLGEITINESVTITGPGQKAASVSGDGSHRVFNIGLTTTPPTGGGVVMSGFSILNGVALGPAQDVGGGIANFGFLTLNDMTVRDNRATFGGGIATLGPLVTHRVTVTQNTAQRSGDSSVPRGVGGGIGAFVAVSSTGDTISSNRAEVAGGNIALQFPLSSTLTDDTIANGAAPVGAGVFVIDGSTPFTGVTVLVQRTTFAGNVARADGSSVGGAIASECGNLILVNDTFDGNRAENGFGGALADECAPTPIPANSFLGARGLTVPALPANPHAPGLRVVAPTPTPNGHPPTVILDFVTMAENLAGRSGGNSIAVNVNANVTVHDTLVDNKATDPGVSCAVVDETGKIASQDYNLESANDCGFNKSHDQTGVANPQLSALASNGGPTQTMALAAKSKAVDMADPTCTNDVATDQRGITRPQGSRCDIGAFELQQTVATPPVTPLPSPPVTGVLGGSGGGDMPMIALIVAMLAIPMVWVGLLVRRMRAD